MRQLSPQNVRNKNRKKILKRIFLILHSFRNKWEKLIFHHSPPPLKTHKYSIFVKRKTQPILLSLSLHFYEHIFFMIVENSEFARLSSRAVFFSAGENNYVPLSHQ